MNDFDRKIERNEAKIQAKIELQATKQPFLTCPQCERSIFARGLKLKRISRLLVGAPKDVIHVAHVWYCVNCNTELTIGE